MSERTSQAFSPLGNTVVISSAATAPTGLQVSVSISEAPEYSRQYRVINAGGVTVHLGVGSTAAAAQSAAVAAAAGTPAAGVPLLPGATEVITFPQNSYFSGYSASNATVYITPGRGL